MVFVHARNATVKTAENLIEQASKRGDLDRFRVKSNDESFSEYGKAVKSLKSSRNKKLADLFENGFSVHHAGLLRTDRCVILSLALLICHCSFSSITSSVVCFYRSLIEKLFSDGLIRVLVCTAT